MKKNIQKIKLKKLNLIQKKYYARGGIQRFSPRIIIEPYREFDNRNKRPRTNKNSSQKSVSEKPKKKAEEKEEEEGPKIEKKQKKQKTKKIQKIQYQQYQKQHYIIMN